MHDLDLLDHSTYLAQMIELGKFPIYLLIV
jgi:hypothetical protein